MQNLTYRNKPVYTVFHIQHVNVDTSMMGWILKRNATLNDVAARAGVSTATVARVIHESGYVSESTRSRVLLAIKAVDYRSNSLARSLKQRRTKAVGQVLQSTFPNTFYVQVALGAERLATELGYSLLTYNVQGDAKAETKAVEAFLSWRVDAILFITPIDDANVTLSLNAGVPAVQVERPVLEACDHVLVDNYVGARAAMDHLLAFGHRRIAFIGQDPKAQLTSISAYVERERLQAYRDALEGVGIQIDTQLISLGNYYNLQDRSANEDGYRAADRFLKVDEPPTAIFASNDILAAGVIQCLYYYGLKVPKEMSVVGFDDTYAAFVTPMLTTVRLPMEELGKAAMQLAIERIEGQTSGGIQTQRFPTQLIVRDSTGPAP
jgi:LacI family transcriptional regulator